MPELATGLVATILLYAAVSKIAAFDEFVSSVPTPGANRRQVRTAIAGLVIGTEAAVALALLSGRLSPLAELTGIAVLSAFTFFLVALLVRRVPARCHCFGSAGGSVSWRDVARNLGLLSLLGLAVLLAPGPERSLYGLLAGGTLFGLLLVLSAGRVLLLAGINWRRTDGPIATVHR